MKIKRICVVGLGYVGLTLSVVLSEKSFEIYGVEADKSVVDRLNNFNPHFHEKGLDVLLKKFLNRIMFISQNIPEKKMDVFIICVGTPLNKKTKKPIMDYVIRASEEVAKNLYDGSLVVLRSTVPVGTTRNIVKPILDKSGKKYCLAFCPERTAEGAALKELRNLPQIIGGIDEESIDSALDIFRKVTPTTIEVSTLEAAEMIKILDNSYRDVNFAYANEIALICERLGLDVLELIMSANMGYPRTNIPIPGFVGGACLEKDPHILVDFAARSGYEPKLIKCCREVNENLPLHVADKIIAKLDKLGKPKTSKIFITGFAFKGQPETDDIRGSLTIELLNKLKECGYKNIYGHDFIVAKEELEKLGIEVCSIGDGFKNSDCVVVATNHLSYSELNIEQLCSLMNKPSLLIDIWRVFESKIVKASGIVYGGVGIG